MTFVTYAIRSLQERFFLCARASEFAAHLGFSRDERARVVLCVAELVSNVVKFAGRGELQLEPLHHGGLRVIVEDEGAGIERPALAIQDGFSEGSWITPDGSWRPRLGLGLGAVARLGDAMRISDSARGGARVEVEFHPPMGQGRSARTRANSKEWEER